jgi:hypothetical protein
MAPGILVAMMFVVLASAPIVREQTSAAGLVRAMNNDGFVVDRKLSDLIPCANCPVSHSVHLKLPLEQLRDTEGRITPNGESFFLLLARRMKSLSLSIRLTASSFDDAEFSTTIAARMMNEVALKSTQIRIGMLNPAASGDIPGNAMLTVTITRFEAVSGGAE